MRKAPIVCSLLTAFSLAATAPALGAPARAGNTATQALHTLFDQTWDRELRDDPLTATYFGDTRFNDRWTDFSAAAIAARNTRDAATLAALKRIPRAALPANEQLNYDLFQRDYEQRLRFSRFKPEVYAISHSGGVQTLSEVTELQPFVTVKDYDNWLARLRGVPTVVDQSIELLRTGLREKRVQPRVIMERVPAQIAMQLPEKAEDSPFYAPFKQFPDSISAADRARLSAAALQAVKDGILPAYRRLQTFFNNDYLPATRSSVGISDTPDGAAYFRELIAYHTTSRELTADQIHDIGLKEVERIRGEMLKIKDEVGFKGSLPEFFTFLRTDPQFYYKTPEELFNGYALITKRIDPELPRLFGKLARNPYGVRAIPMTSAPNTTTAYYQPGSPDGTRAGFYYVNLYRPEVRPRWEMEVLTVHEAVPGHHLQISLAQEQAEMPQFRRNAGYTAYVEGWALYSERLGYELGLYKDPYSRFGQLTYDMWRAVRLVVDTGMHAKGWSRQQAVDFFKTNAPKTDTDINNEIDRYIAGGGQALAYKIGQLQILRLRSEAEQRLGKQFDIRAFHDALLSTGAVPLDVMTAHMHRWMASQQARKPQ